MANTPPVLPAKIVALTGETITVQLRRIPTVPTDIVYSVERNGVKEGVFSMTEFQAVLNTLQSLLNSVRSGAPLPQPTTVKP